MSRNRVCFVISPIGDPEADARGDAKDVLNNLIKPALTLIKEKTGLEFTATRSDQVAVVGEIVDHVVRRILSDDVIIAVLFNRNPNVYYELGIAHSAGRPVVLLKKKEEDRHFDISTHSMVEYSWQTLRDQRPPHERSEVRELAEAITSASQHSRDSLAFEKYDPLGRHFTDFRVLNKFADLKFDDYSSFFDVKRGFIGLMGVSLHYFTRADANWTLPTGETASFAALIQSKVVVDGCHVVLVMMDETNPALPQMLRGQGPGDLDAAEITAVRTEIEQSNRRWQNHIASVTELSRRTDGGTMRLVKVRRGLIYHRLSITDRAAIVTPYFFHIGTNSGGPAIVADARTALYDAVRRDFEYLVERNSIPAGARPRREHGVKVKAARSNRNRATGGQL
jgi:hypothetical protein